MAASCAGRCGREGEEQRHQECHRKRSRHWSGREKSHCGSVGIVEMHFFGKKDT
jgi:hypothetical protein